MYKGYRRSGIKFSSRDDKVEFIFETILEVIMEPILEGYIFAMSQFANNPKKISEEKIKVYVIFEAIALFLMFVVGGIMLAESDGKNLIGKVIFKLSIVVSAVQILLGIILNILKKIKNNRSRQPMDERQLTELIYRMCNEEECSSTSDSISWKAYREAEKLSDTSFLPFLEGIIWGNSKNDKKDKKTRRAVYFIIGKTIKNSFDESGCKFLIERLDIETDRYVLSAIMDLFISINVPPNIDIEPIVRHSKSDVWLIRHSAIHALGCSDTTKSKEALYYYLNLTDEKEYRYEIVYANSALGNIGNEEDIPILEQHINSRISDIRESARYAIETINKRHKKEF